MRTAGTDTQVMGSAIMDRCKVARNLYPLTRPIAGLTRKSTFRLKLGQSYCVAGEVSEVCGTKEVHGVRSLRERVIQHFHVCAEKTRVFCSHFNTFNTSI